MIDYKPRINFMYRLKEASSDYSRAKEVNNYIKPRFSGSYAAPKMPEMIA